VVLVAEMLVVQDLLMLQTNPTQEHQGDQVLVLQHLPMVEMQELEL
jgi:hypothetical protein